VDTGITTVSAMRYLKRYKPASLRLCALLDKPARRRVSVAIDYVGRQAPDRFVVGYGIDFNEQYRQLPAIYVLKE
jgi:hypoxanthine phosphoribosyltransferase